MVKHVRERARSQPAQGAKAKVKARARKKHPGKGNHNQDQAVSPNEDGQRTLGDFGTKRQRVEFVGDVQERIMILRGPPFGLSSLCVLCAKVQQYFNGFDGTAEFVEESL